MAPITKKLGAGSSSKTGAGFAGKSSSGKNSNPSMSSGKSNPFASSAKSANSSSSGKSSSAFAFTGKASNAFSLGKSSSPKTSGKSGSLLGSSGKSSPPILVGGKPSFSPKSYPSTSSSSPKKSSTNFGIIWIPTRRNKKKEYVHVSHNYEGRRDRSPSMYPFEHMSGDSSNHQSIKKKEDDSNALLVPERPKGPIATAASAGVAVASVEPQRDNAETQTPEDKQEKQEFIKYDREDNKEAAGDMAKEDKDDKSFLDNDSTTSKSHDKWEKGDKLDSVYLRPPPPHKVRSNTPSNEEDDCGIKCLYYTLQCCDCVLM